MRRRRWVAGALLAAAVILVAGRAASGWYVDYLWYASADALSVWKARAANLVILRATVFTFAFAFLAANFYAVRHSIRAVVFPKRIGNIEFPLEVPGRTLTLLAFISAAVVAAVVAAVPDEWVGLALMRDGLRFGENDPFFGLDIAQWLFRIPLERRAHTWSLVLSAGTSLFVVLLYALTPGLRWDRGRLTASSYVRRHLGILAAFFLVLLSWRYRLGAYELLWEGSGPDGAFVAADHRFALPAALVMSIVCLASAFLVAFTVWTGQARGTVFVLVLTVLAAASSRYVARPIASRFLIEEGSGDIDRPYVETRRLYTARAFALRRVTPLEVEGGLPPLPVVARGIPLWDRAALRIAAMREQPGIAFVSDIGFATVGGRLTAFGARLVSSVSGSDTVPHWEVFRVAAERVQPNGRPLPARSDFEPGSTQLPLVTAHEGAASYYVLSDSAARVRAVPLEPPLNRVAHAWYLRNPRLLRHDGEDVRILLYRDVRERIARLYPCFVQGSNVAPLVWRDSLYWVVQLYSASRWYPLAARVGAMGQRFGYLTHAAVALVNSHSSATYAVLSASADSVAFMCARRFGKLFRDVTSVDQALLLQLPVAEELLEATGRAAAITGVEGLGSNLRPVAQLADSAIGGSGVAQFADVRNGTVWSALGLEDRNSGQLRGLLVMRSGSFGVRYLAVRHALQLSALEERLRNARDTLLSLPGGGRHLRGALRLVPLPGSLLAAQTHYVEHQSGVPLPTYVAVFHDGRVTTGGTVAAALGLPYEIDQDSLSSESLLERVRALYRAMDEALVRGDWEAFGSAYRALGRLLRSVPR